MTEAELVVALMDAPVPRPEALANTAARRLFPIWQALLVGLPIGLIAAAMLGVATSLAVALPLGMVVGHPLPPWLGHVSEAAMLPDRRRPDRGAHRGRCAWPVQGARADARGSHGRVRRTDAPRRVDRTAARAAPSGIGEPLEVAAIDADMRFLVGRVHEGV